jgi:MFS transporter, DHA2 family, methylenomycin A resistance protein
LKNRRDGTRAAARFGPRAVLGVGALLMIAGLVALLRIGAGSSYPSLAVQLAAIGFGLGLIVPAMTSSLLGSVDAERSGVASGTLNTARQTGSVIGVALAISIALAAAAGLLALKVEREDASSG